VDKYPSVNLPWTLLLALALPVYSARCVSGASVLPHPAQNGFVPLSQWANEHGLKPAGTKKDDAVTLTNESFKLSFKTDSQLADINGVNVWLCQPVTPKNGRVCIGSLDLNSSIEPILFPHTNQVHATIRTICLDPGHGHQDTGGIFGRYMEKQYTLPLAEALAGQLKAAGFKVILTRTNDAFVQLADRPAFANRQKADLFISLHFNIGPPGEAKGVEVYCLTPPKAKSTNAGRWGEISEWSDDTGSAPGNRCDDWNVALAYQLQKSLVKNLFAEDRGVRRARFAVLRTAKMPAVLIEGGFLSDSDEQKKIADSKYRGQLAAAIVRGVLNYQSIFEDRPSTRNQHEITRHRRQTDA